MILRRLTEHVKAQNWFAVAVDFVIVVVGVFVGLQVSNWNAARADRDRGHAYLDRIAVLLTTKTGKQIAVEGHTDNVGAAALNQKLSEQRADAVADALVTRGVPAARISRRGFSFTQPAAPNDVEAGRRLNRRTELIVIDETVANITRGEPANAFEDAAARVKAALEAGKGKS